MKHTVCETKGTTRDGSQWLIVSHWLLKVGYIRRFADNVDWVSFLVVWFQSGIWATFFPQQIIFRGLGLVFYPFFLGWVGLGLGRSSVTS